MYTLLSRPPTKAEGDIIVGQTKQTLADFGCLGIFLIGGIFAYGAIGGCMGGWISDDAGTIGQWSGWGFGCVLSLLVLIWAIPHHRRLQATWVQDKEQWRVEEITVSDARVIEIGLISNRAPILAFQIGEGKILFLQGQWLLGPDIYDAPIGANEEWDEFMNGLPEPFAFPSTAFTITRLPNSGSVLKITATGRYLVWEKVVEALRAEFEFRDSEMLEGNIDDIAEVLRQEHTRRSSRSGA